MTISRATSDQPNDTAHVQSTGKSRGAVDKRRAQKLAEKRTRAEGLSGAMLVNLYDDINHSTA